LKNFDLSPDSFQIEITETSLINDFENTALIIENLQSMGFQIALDDFGTGYSSLSYLKNFPINTVKIDKSYFDEFPDNLRDTSLIKAIISLSRSLGLRIVAEGVETVQQLDALMQMRCDSVQGYVFSKPLSDVQASSLLLDARDIRDLINFARIDSSAWRSQNSNAISGVLNDIGPIDLVALSKYSRPGASALTAGESTEKQTARK
jgi:EAL domain-containing protein (putative c-di-GMP-specific phosphodiesterase class I)